MILSARTVVMIINSVIHRQNEQRLVATVEKTTDLACQLAAEHARTSELTRQLALANANFDWLRVHVNELKIERAELYRKLGYLVPVAEIARTEAASAALPNADDGYTPTRPALGDLLAKARDIVTGAPDRGMSEGGELSFEDMGDDAARRAHLTHDDEGHLLVTR
jgi:hypothetical protein